MSVAPSDGNGWRVGGAALLWSWLLAVLLAIPLPLAGACALLTVLLACLLPWVCARARGALPAGVRRMTPDLLRRKLARDGGQRCYLGQGAPWQARHSVALHAAQADAHSLSQGPAWQPGAHAAWVDAELLARNVLAVGAPGAGKSSLLVLLAWQAQLRGEAVIVLDPKGSRALQAQIFAGAAASNRPHLALLPTRPAVSSRYDPFMHCADAGAVATRVCSLIPGERQDPFRDFCWGVLSTLAEALQVLGAPVTLSTLQDLLADAGASLLAHWGPAGAGIAPARHAAARRALEDLVAHDRTHFRKMTVALLPVLNLLCAGPLSSLLAPLSDTDSSNAAPGSDARPLLDIAVCRAQGTTVYVGLDALGHSRLAQALAQLLFEDVAAEAAGLLSRTDVVRPLHLLVDEAGELACDALLQLLGKGREARVHLLLAVQTLADLEWRLGSAAAARVAEGNAGAWFLFRQLDALSRQESSARLGQLAAVRPAASRALSTSSGVIAGVRQRSESVGETTTREFLPRVPEASFSALRDLECLAAMPDGALLHLRLPLPVPA